MSDRKCLVPQCNRTWKARGLCPMHYQSQQARDQYGLVPRKIRTSIEDRLTQYEVDPETGCWIWMAGLRGNGYGNVRVPGKNAPAHRVSYEFHVGPIPPKTEVCHRCDVPRCINPDHLFLGSHAINMADMAAKGRGGNYPHERCNRGHLFDEANTLYPTSGGRQCRACNRARYEAKRAAMGLPVGRVPKTHCPQRHEFDEANTYVTKNNMRHCRICGRDASARYEAKRRSNQSQ